MFQDFDEKASDGEADEKRRRAASLGLSLVVFGGLALTLGALVATAHAVVQKEREVAVSFAELPAMDEAPAPPPPPPPPPKPQQRKKAKKVVSGTPDSIPDEQPEESDADLVEATDTGPIDGMVDGEGDVAGQGDLASPQPSPPSSPVEHSPAQRRESLSRPQFLAGCRSPEAPAELVKSAATIRIEVRFIVAPTGEPSGVRIVEPHPMIPDQLVLDCIATQRFSPARLSDGTAIPFPFHRTFIFRPAVI